MTRSRRKEARYRKDKTLNLRMSSADKELLDQLVEFEKMTISDLIFGLLYQRSRQVLGKKTFT